jgi:hypothetical protein
MTMAKVTVPSGTATQWAGLLVRIAIGFLA